jgi:hypothetical protein
MQNKAGHREQAREALALSQKLRSEEDQTTGPNAK